MARFILLFLIVTFLSCQEQKHIDAKVEGLEEVKRERKRHFEKITFSVMQGWNKEKFDTDVEINQDGTFYYRLRERYCCPIKANYTGELDSLHMSKVYAILDSIDFNTLKFVEYDAEDASYFSILFTMYNGEIRIKGTLDDNLHDRVRDLLELIEAQSMKQSSNHKYSTAKDVILPPPNFTPSQALLGSL